MDSMAWHADVDYQRLPDYYNPQPSYYLIRKLVFTHSCRDEKLKCELCSTLSAASVGALYPTTEMCTWLCCDVRDDDLGVVHSMPQDKDKRIFQDNPIVGGCTPEWEWADEVAKAAQRDRVYGTHRLEDDIFKSVWCTKCLRHRHP